LFAALAFAFSSIHFKGYPRSDAAIAASVIFNPNGAENAAPNFKLTSTDGKTIELSNYRGKVVILDFWATWCPPCKAEIPDFIKLYSKYKKDGFQMLGISVDQGGLDAVKPFMKEYGVNYPIMLATENVINEYGGIRGIPTTFVIDKEGRIVYKFVGYRPAPKFEALIERLTKQK
jgi:cytochrome c biogenesis protein CcmG/thiol:disulfide interchange protein DsbE